MTATQQSSGEEKTIVGFNTNTRIIIYSGFGVLGLVFGYFIPRIAAWALTLPWVPFEGPIKLIHSLLNGPWMEWVTAMIGLIAGLVLAYISIKESLIATISDQEVQLDKDGHAKRIKRSEIDQIFIDRKELVILGTSGHELLREKHEESPKLVEEGFKKHGYPWSREGDPYKDQYRRWVLDTPDLPPAVNALMKAREKALQKKENTDIKDLRNELEKSGYIVRDEETRQYYRPIPKQ
ncbi:uncharacterized membrane-anchored protein YhcB (DUF1043 family) [Bacillus pakistanensis]|uniref:Uncharacterized membrane-anchored protein YhcB (DUF1043 family) n=1 Tax=Rossellomorea pakistanensis TaxID=992288 RepID=A0ABS2NCL9_9BACI|nr:DUF308 domain-containing protein [Bacillus pakistanensis]MBM7585570.1 uncharacterized membrane-anchored protein YhcB (DUF1043 family) [Bacillus pakistanensis]